MTNGHTHRHTHKHSQAEGFSRLHLPWISKAKTDKRILGRARSSVVRAGCSYHTSQPFSYYENTLSLKGSCSHSHTTHKKLSQLSFIVNDNTLLHVRATLISAAFHKAREFEHAEFKSGVRFARAQQQHDGHGMYVIGNSKMTIVNATFCLHSYEASIPSTFYFAKQVLCFT